MQIYIHRNGQQLGPFTEAEVKAQLASGAISLLDHVWWQGQANWIPLGQSPLGTTTPPLPPASTPLRPSPLPGAPNIPYHLTNVTQTSNLATWSLVFGLLGLFCCFLGPLVAIPAVIFGHMSLAEIKRNPAMSGRGMAIAGLILGYLTILLFCLGMLSALVQGTLGNQVKETFKTIDAQLNHSQTPNPQDSSTSDSSSNNANPDSSTNSTTTVTP